MFLSSKKLASKICYFTGSDFWYATILSVIKALQLANFFNVHQVHWRDQNVSLNLPEMERAPQRQDTVSDH